MGAYAVSEALLSDAKNYLDMTWAGDTEDKKLSGILARGMAYLDHIAGVNLIYTDESNARALLFDYVRYVRANALQDFASDFQTELMGLHIAGEVEQHEQADSSE